MQARRFKTIEYDHFFDLKGRWEVDRYKVLVSLGERDG